jgi:hypothetical protein
VVSFQATPDPELGAWGDERTEQILASLQELKSRSDRENIKAVILALQPVVLALIGVIDYEDRQAMKAEAAVAAKKQQA